MYYLPRVITVMDGLFVILSIELPKYVIILMSLYGIICYKINGTHK